MNSLENIIDDLKKSYNKIPEARELLIALSCQRVKKEYIILSPSEKNINFATSAKNAGVSVFHNLSEDTTTIRMPMLLRELVAKDKYRNKQYEGIHTAEQAIKILQNNCIIIEKDLKLADFIEANKVMKEMLQEKKILFKQIQLSSKVNYPYSSIPLKKFEKNLLTSNTPLRLTMIDFDEQNVMINMNIDFQSNSKISRDDFKSKETWEVLKEEIIDNIKNVVSENFKLNYHSFDLRSNIILTIRSEDVHLTIGKKAKPKDLTIDQQYSFRKEGNVRAGLIVKIKTNEFFNFMINNF